MNDDDTQAIPHVNRNERGQGIRGEGYRGNVSDYRRGYPGPTGYQPPFSPSEQIRPVKYVSPVPAESDSSMKIALLSAGIAILCIIMVGTVLALVWGI